MKKVFQLLNTMVRDNEVSNYAIGGAIAAVFYVEPPTKLYQRKEAHRKNEARRPASEKMATVARLRDFERSLEQTQKANRAKRAAKEIKIDIKTR